MLEAEITVNGDVLVEGHIVGQLQGFRFALDGSTGGDDAKSIQTAAMKSLALEYDARAYRFAAAPNGDIALGSDGYVRWLGAPIATLAASDEFLKPRVILLADEQLSGGSRDMVETRVTRFVNFQIDQALKPLADLAEGNGLEGMAKGLAYRIFEAQGVIKRRDVADDAKALDQEARSNLRKMGVRFGAYHIYLPALLKPAPAQLITLLWALKNDAKEKPGYGDVVAALAAGRTSIVADPAFEREFYRIGGFRYLGKRAVRIDILERLADFIRPTLSWKKGQGARPAGAYDGERFLVTPAMMSILGATATDMEEILRGLGYRSETLSLEVVDGNIAEIDAAVAAAAPAPETPEVIVEHVKKIEIADKSEVTEDVATDAVAAEPAAPEEPKTVLLWKQGKFEPRQQEGARANNSRRPARPAAGAAAATDGAAPAQNRGPRRDFKKPQGEGEARQGGRPQRDNRDNSRQDNRDGGKPQFDRNNKRPNDHKGGGKPQGDYAKSREKAEPKFDPDSPFAKLAALRDQMKK